MKNKCILITFASLMLISFLFLAYVENKQHKLTEANFWSMAFANPKSADFNFVIENYTDHDNFEWQILADNNKISEGNAIIQKGSFKEIKPEINSSNLTNKKITIEVTSASQKKDIYKNL